MDLKFEELPKAVGNICEKLECIERILMQHQSSVVAQNEELLTIQQAAEFLHLSTFTIYGLVSRSEIPSMKRGKRLYFSREDLTSWVKETRRGTVCDAAKEADAYLSTKRKRG